MSTRDLAYYGDDFTGSTDVLEALSRAGVDTVLFLSMPDEAALARFAHCRAIGLAGASRSQSPAWMDEHLPLVFAWMKSLGARISHYKVCSTFDSSPQTGSIGRAIELGRREFGVPFVPLLVGAPALRRYVVFGNLFATAGEETYRIDRHPTMSRHPVTPMDEGDLRLHLARQTSLRIGLVDLLALESGRGQTRLLELAETGAEVVLLDTLNSASLEHGGALVWNGSPAPQAFVAGSSGLEYALIAHWRAAGLLGAPPPLLPAPCADRLTVLSGSCSPGTDEQIRWAASNGYAAIALDAAALAAESGYAAAGASAVDQAVEALAHGANVVLHSAGHGAARVALDPAGRDRLAARSGAILDEVITRSGIGRVVVAGGDTSSHAGPALGLDALTFLAPVAPGAPLCRAHSARPERDGLEIVFKGGQCGGPDFFERTRSHHD